MVYYIRSRSQGLLWESVKLYFMNKKYTRTHYEIFKFCCVQSNFTFAQLAMDHEYNFSRKAEDPVFFFLLFSFFLTSFLIGMYIDSNICQMLLGCLFSILICLNFYLGTVTYNVDNSNVLDWSNSTVCRQAFALHCG